MRLSSDLIRGYCAAQGWESPAPGTLFVWALRSASPGPGEDVTVHEPQPDRYDDTLGLGGTEWLMAPATTDPGRFWTQHPMNPRGAAWLVPGSYWFRQGYHKLPGNWALVQDQAVTVRRDRNRDGVPQENDGPRESGWFGIHVHSGGFLAWLVGRWSAGCLVSPAPYFAHFRAVVQRRGARRVLVVLIDARLFQAWLAAKG